MFWKRLTFNNLKIELEYPVVELTQYPNNEKTKILLNLARKFGTSYIVRWVENKLLAFSIKDEKYFALYRGLVETKVHPDGSVEVFCNVRRFSEEKLKELKEELNGTNSDILIYACDSQGKYKTIDLVPLELLVTEKSEVAGSD